MIELTIEDKDSTGVFEVVAEITWFEHKEPDYSSWDSADDYYGYTDVEYDILECTLYDEDGVGHQVDCPDWLDDEVFEEAIKEVTKDDY